MGGDGGNAGGAGGFGGGGGGGRNGGRAGGIGGMAGGGGGEMVATYSYRAVYAKGMKRRGVIDTRKYAFLSHRLWQERLQSSTHSVQVGSWQVHSGSDGVGRVAQHDEQVQQLGNEKDDAALTGSTSTSASAAPAPSVAPTTSPGSSVCTSIVLDGFFLGFSSGAAPPSPPSPPT